MQADIEKIITDGTLAPSGENCQPWKFFVAGNRIQVFNVPEADQSLYNYKQRGSYVAHGALIENIFISASKYGYTTQIQIFPELNNHDLVSTITLEKTSPKNEPLYPYIQKRHTNRKDHESQKLTSTQKSVLVEVAKETGLGELKMIDDQPTLDVLGKALAVNEQMIFENKELHSFFYNHVLWNSEEQEKAGGFYIKTLEFLPHQLRGVKIFKHWHVLKILNKIGKVSRVIAKENAEKYAKSGAFAVIMINGNTDVDYVNAGRVAEKVWLTATRLGISVHPCTGVLYFMENIRAGNIAVFSEKHRHIIKEAYGDIVKMFDAEGKTIPMLFRLGFAGTASARSMRMKPNINFT